jgi:hypothetical protein
VAGGASCVRGRQSDWRAIYRRAADSYAILAIDRHKNFAALIESSQARAGRGGHRNDAK